MSAALAGLWLARKLYLDNPKLHGQIAAAWPRLHRLLMRRYYVDEIYDALFVNRTKDLSMISMWWDKWIVDGLVNFRRLVS